MATASLFLHASINHHPCHLPPLCQHHPLHLLQAMAAPHLHSSHCSRNNNHPLPTAATPTATSFIFLAINHKKQPNLYSLPSLPLPTFLTSPATTFKPLAATFNLQPSHLISSLQPHPVLLHGSPTLFLNLSTPTATPPPLCSSKLLHHQTLLSRQQLLPITVTYVSALQLSHRPHLQYKLQPFSHYHSLPSQLPHFSATTPFHTLKLLLQPHQPLPSPHGFCSTTQQASLPHLLLCFNNHLLLLLQPSRQLPSSTLFFNLLLPSQQQAATHNLLYFPSRPITLSRSSLHSGSSSIITILTLSTLSSSAITAVSFVFN